MWIQVEDTIRDHDKIFKLSDILGITDAHAVGLMVCLWTWVAANAPDGDLSEFPPRAIAAAAKWGEGCGAVLRCTAGSTVCGTAGGWPDSGPQLGQAAGNDCRLFGKAAGKNQGAGEKIPGAQKKGKVK